MENKRPPTTLSFARLPTGVPGFDDLIQGGFLAGGVYLIMGPPGTGKTIFANQMAFHHVQQGGKVVYLTLLAESHSRMVGNLRPLSFFDEGQLQTAFSYFGAYQTLATEGLFGLLKMIGETIRKHGATMLFIDGVASAEELSGPSSNFKKFVHDLSTVASTSGCTSFLLSSTDTKETKPEHTMVDGIVSLSLGDDGMRTFREIQVVKFRGGFHSMGYHFFRIGDRGLRVFPRLESRPIIRVPSPPVPQERLTFGNSKLDDLLGGGLYTSTVTSVIGSAGTGKTTLAASFLAAGAARGEKGIFFSFYEPPESLLRKAAQGGLTFGPHNGLVEFIWQLHDEHYVDEMADTLLNAIRESKARRVAIDGIAGLKNAMIHPNRVARALPVIAHALRLLGVAAVFTEEVELFSPEIDVPVSHLSAVTDNIIVLRQIEMQSKLRRFLSVTKVRDSQCNTDLHEFEIMDGGLRIGQPDPQLESVLTGQPRVRGATAKKTKNKPKLQRRRVPTRR